MFPQLVRFLFWHKKERHTRQTSTFVGTALALAFFPAILVLANGTPAAA
jgi:hypothetical protein